MFVVLALASILALYAIPSLRSTIANNRVDTLANQLVATMALARSEAVKLGQSVYVYSASTATPYDWGAGGWCVTQAASCAAAAGSTTAPLVQGGGPVSSPMTLIGNATKLQFDPTGRLVGVGAGVEVDFIACADGATPTAPLAAGVTVTASGRARVATAVAGQRPQMSNGTLMASCAGP